MRTSAPSTRLPVSPSRTVTTTRMRTGSCRTGGGGATTTGVDEGDGGVAECPPQPAENAAADTTHSATQPLKTPTKTDPSDGARARSPVVGTRAWPRARAPAEAGTV